MDTRLKIIKVDENEPTPEKVYKYREFGKEYHRNMISKNEFYFAMPMELNDPFEFKQDVKMSAEDVRDFASEKFKNFLDENPGFGMLGAKEKDIFSFLLSDEIFEAVHEKLINEHNEACRRIYRVFSASIEKGNTQLWGIYSNSGLGFCVEIDVVALLENLSKIFKGKDSWVLHGPVAYSDNFPVTHVHYNRQIPVDEIKRYMFQKSIKWISEKEYRVVYREIGDMNFERGDDRQLPFDNVITAVYFGCRYKENDDFENTVQPIIDACRKRNIPIYVAHQHPREYKLVFEPLED